MKNDSFIIIDSLHVLEQNWRLVLAILACVAWGTLLIFAVLKKTTVSQFVDTDLSMLALAGWPLPLLLISSLIFFLRTFIADKSVFIIALIAAVLSAGFAIHSLKRKISLGIASPILFFLFLAFVRLGFSSDLPLPPYFDSAEHYRIIQVLLGNNNKTNFIWPITTYYHLGYHFIVAAMAWVTHAAIGPVMLLFGQIVLAAIPLPIYFLVHHTTNSKTAAFFSVLLAAFGWYMPAHAVNWGKYPALLSLLLIQFTLGAALIKNRGLLAFALLASILIHTRSIIFLAIFWSAWAITTHWVDQPRIKRNIFFALVLTLFGMATLLIKRDQILSPILGPYLVWVTLLVGLLAVAAFRSFPHLVIFPLSAMLLMLTGLFIPITSAITLLDRPLVEMMIFLPLAYLGGLGVLRLPKFSVTILAASIIIHAWLIYDFSPSDCCQLVNQDDMAALNWIDTHLPANARVAIATTDLPLNTFGSLMQEVGTDAGIWVMPLTQRSILAMSYSTDFITQNTRTMLCGQKVTHIYIGARPQSFEFNFAEAKPAWYEIVFSLPKARIVHLINCDVE